MTVVKVLDAAWAKLGGHELLKHEEESDVFRFWIEKS